jgi:adenosylcobinamide kinase/adenosylcobinamide-phosphate guanylyltransferase
MSSHISLILGGARSGKSRRAEWLAAQSSTSVVYVATWATSASDDEMRARVLAHRSQRPDGWVTVENRFDLPALFEEFSGRTVLLDCLTLWLSFHCESKSESVILEYLKTSLALARSSTLRLLMVSNELGMGLVPSTPMGRGFRDLCGRANQLVAAEADFVELQVAGLPLVLKGGEKP